MNILYKLVKDADYLANFKIKVSTAVRLGEYVTDDATLKFTDMSPNFMDR